MKSLSLPPWTVPIGLLGLAFLAFGILIPWLGFYWDDWPAIQVARQQGVGAFWDFYTYDRPFSAWTYVITMPILGTTPLPWHIFTLLLRWLTTLGMWWTLRGIWKGHDGAITLAAFLFMVYPIFTQQAIAVAYSQHWTCYALYFLSLGAMVRAVHASKRRLLWMIISLAACGLHIWTMEYFIGLELLRPLILWELSAPRRITLRKRLRWIVKFWSPFLAVLGLFILYRLFWLKIPGGDPNTPQLLLDFFHAPLSVAVQFAQLAFQDIAYMLVNVWAETVAPSTILLTDRSVLLSWGLALLTTVAVTGFLLANRQVESTEKDRSADPWARRAALFGLAAILLGTLPVWITGRQAIVGFFSTRFGLGAMFGASLLLTAALEGVVSRRSHRVIIIAILVGLAAGMHLRTSNEYRLSWIKQQRYAWQLAWRAPSIAAHTAILSEGEFIYVGRHASTATLNLIYPPAANPRQPNYWFFTLGRVADEQMDSWLNGAEISDKARFFNFSAAPRSSLVVYADKPGCLWVIPPNDRDLPDLPDKTRAALGLSNLSRISSQALPIGYPPADIFGEEPAHNWCFYFEKTELARQEKNWQEILRLAQEAQGKGYTPQKSESNEPREWFAIIEAYAHTGNDSIAEALSAQILQRDSRYTPAVCRLWKQTAEDSQGNLNPSRVQSILSRLNCPK
ncbi:MAG TPA: hypothetical protein VIO61_06780 [Anaerolineaceae bacterium]